MSTFRSEVFKICKELQTKEISHKISSLIRDMSVSTENKETGEIKNTRHGDFAYVAKHSKNQFHGYLYTDENVDIINKQVPFHVEKLLKEERELLEIGHRTLVRFIQLCLSDLKSKSAAIAESMNPYSIFKKVPCDDLGERLLTDEEMQSAVQAYKNGKVYQTLLKSNLATLFNNTPIEQMIALIDITGKEVKKSYDDISNSTIEKLFARTLSGYNNIEDVMVSVSILFFALKESLQMACNLFYEAICGDDLIVLNNDNIINIENQTSNRAVERYKVLIQDTNLHISGDSIGSILLLDCETMQSTKIHVFGMIIASTLSFACDMGCTTKYTFITVNDELINIQNITDYILEKDLPQLTYKRIIKENRK